MSDACVLSTDAAGTAILWNIATRTQVAVYKEHFSVARGSALVLGSREDGRRHADGIIGCQIGRAVVHMYSMAKNQPLFKCGMPEPMHSAAVSADGAHVVCGGASGRAYLWVLSSGALLRVWSAHYKRVGAIAFSPCGTVVFTGGDDGIIQAWPVCSLVDVVDQADLTTPPTPCATWTEHSLPITSLRFGPGVGLSALLVSTSLDRTARLWDAAAGRCVATIECPSAVHASCVDPLQRRLYLSCTADASGAGTSTPACVCEVDLHAAAARAADPGALVLGGPAAAGGGFVGAALLSGAAGSGGGFSGFNYPCFVGHTGLVHELVTSPDGVLLLTASHDGSVRAWDTTSRGCMYVFDAHKGSPVLSLLLVPRYSHGVGAAGGSSAGAGAAAPHTPMAPLKKHQVPVAVEWKGSSTGPLDALVAVARAPLDAVGAPGSDFDLGLSRGGAAARYAADVGALLAALDTAAAAGGSEGLLAAAPLAQVSDELAELRRRVAQLEDENRRWQVVNNALLSKVKSGDVASSVSGAGNQTADSSGASQEPSFASAAGSAIIGSERSAAGPALAMGAKRTRQDGAGSNSN